MHQQQDVLLHLSHRPRAVQRRPGALRKSKVTRRGDVSGFSATRNTHHTHSPAGTSVLTTVLQWYNHRHRCFLTDNAVFCVITLHRSASATTSVRCRGNVLLETHHQVVWKRRLLTPRKSDGASHGDAALQLCTPLCERRFTKSRERRGEAASMNSNDHCRFLYGSSGSR